MPVKTYDAIVVGSGITGGWAAKELTEKGLETLVLEAGRPIEPNKDYVEHVPIWQKKFRDLGDRNRFNREQPVQQKCFVVVHLHITAECPASRIDPRRHIKQPGLLRVHLDERSLAVGDGWPPAGINQSDVLVGIGIRRVADEDAGIVHPALDDRSREIHGKVGRANRDARERLVLSGGHNHFPGL